jgi:hypothetical protein
MLQYGLTLRPLPRPSLRCSSEAYKLQVALAADGRSGDPPLAPHQRQLLAALALQDRRCKEVAAALAKASASSPAGAHDLWQAQLRAYHCQPPAHARAGGTKPLGAAKAAAAGKAAAAPLPDVLVLRCNGLEQEYGWGPCAWAVLCPMARLVPAGQTLPGGRSCTA